MPLAGQVNAQVIVGQADVKIGNYVAAAGAGTLLSFGYTLSPTEFGFSFEDFEVEVEQAISPVKIVPQKASYTLKVDVAQNNPEAMRILTRSAAANLTGTSPNETLVFNDPIEQYHQVAFVTAGYGTTGVDTYLLWRVAVSTTDPIPFGKAAVQKLTATLKITQDASVASPLTNGKYGKRIAA